MGYRHYFYLIEKQEVQNIKRMTYEQLLQYVELHGWESDDDWFSLMDVFNQKKIFEFGKLYWDNTADRIYSTGVPLFDRLEVQNSFSDYRPYIVGKSGLEMAIQIYKEKILNYFKSLVKEDTIPENILALSVKPNDLKLDVVCDAVQEKILRWSNVFGTCPVNMDEESETISNSWLFEYQIFELVRLYKSLDWDKYTVLFYGW